MTMRSRGIVLAAAAGLGLCGCIERAEPVGGAAAGIGVDDILDRCARRYSGAASFEGEGTLLDRREGTARTSAVHVTLQRPELARIEIDGDVSVVHGREVWTYRSASDRFDKYRAFTTTPALTAAELMSGGVTFLCVDLFVRGESALRESGETRTSWRLDGMDFSGGRPCYVLERDGGGGGSRLRIWIDQDHDALRRWSVYRRPVRDADDAIVTMEYHRVRFDAPSDGGRFRVGRAVRARPAR